MALTSSNERELARMLPREVMAYLGSLQLVSPAKDAEGRVEEPAVSVRHTPMTKLLPQTVYSQQPYSTDVLTKQRDKSSPHLTQTDCGLVSTTHVEDHYGQSPIEALQFLSPRKQ